MQGFVVRVNALLNPLTRGRLEQPIDGGGRIEDDHRGLRSSCAFFLDQAGSIEPDGNRLALMQTLA